MKIYYDFHIHSCLSPCGDDDMTPNNIVNMALLNGLDVIALTDHNSCENCEATMKVGLKNGLVVIPGMELCTTEEIHTVCLFSDCDCALNFSNFVLDNILKVKNKPEIFGHQLKLNEFDEVIGEREDLLLTASSIGIDELPSLVKSFGGVMIPAHIDRESYSVLSNLGFFPEELDVSTVEITKNCNLKKIISSNKIIETKKFIIDSDAHYLENISERSSFIDLLINFEKSKNFKDENFHKIIREMVLQQL